MVIKMQKINCNVYDCTFCNCKHDKCSLQEINVCNCKDELTKDSTMCDSYKKRD